MSIHSKPYICNLAGLNQPAGRLLPNAIYSVRKDFTGFAIAAFID